jgi:hypothetical protein
LTGDYTELKNFRFPLIISDRHQLVQQVQMIGSGALGPQAAQVIRHVAAQNGVWSLGNFGGVPPRSAMTSCETVSQLIPLKWNFRATSNFNLFSILIHLSPHRKTLLQPIN